MKVVINIPEKAFELLKNKSNLDAAEAIIAGGTPLHKEHGKIGDIDRLYAVFKKNVVGADAYKQLFDIAPAIIEADIGEK